MKTVLSQRLRAARQAIYPPVTQREVAKRLKRSASAINLWEAGKTQPSAEDLAELSRWFQVSADWLLGVDGAVLAARKKGSAPPLYTVPVVPPSALLRWRWEAVQELLQTSVAYPPNTAAGMLVASDALTSVCPTGCYAVISKADTARPGQVVLAAVSRAGDPVLRKYVKEGPNELLVADDTRYPSYRLRDGVRIIGRVTETTVRRKF
ncbi:S24_LexA-like domain containing protein [uncultured Caudovirales phage]|uniref:S24_LexA-like domain containing protein n=1 Tax=uncultured Caudovirales phage TaxID=2100421 RepID=A0A6J5N5B6_9CAUD|nr:S24_LexA-like domain containing protein [uncultured Caudovirales phage]